VRSEAQQAERIEALARTAGVDLPAALLGPAEPACPVQELAASGVMWLTGPADGPPVMVDDPIIGSLRVAARAVNALAAPRSPVPPSSAGQILVERAAARSMRRRGTISAGGACRFVPCADGWLAVNLPRRTDIELLPAWLGRADATDWPDVFAVAGARTLDHNVKLAEPLGLAVAAVDFPPDRPPFTLHRLGRAAESVRERLTVADFTTLWAGPLCAHLLGRRGAHVRKIEDPHRPDGARIGDPALFARLHAGHEPVPVDFAAGPDRIRRVVAEADVVLEASRPRALEQLGLSPAEFLGARAGRVWLSITGYGRANGGRVAFGDDAAAAGGLVAWRDGTPQFIGDAIADPISGLYAALGASLALAAGGGIHVDVSMRDASAFVHHGPRCPGAHRLEADGDGWYVWHDETAQRVLAP
jgi:hypothetical protein